MVGSDECIPDGLCRWWKEVPQHYHAGPLTAIDIINLHDVFGQHLPDIVAFMLAYPREVIGLVYYVAPTTLAAHESAGSTATFNFTAHDG